MLLLVQVALMAMELVDQVVLQFLPQALLEILVAILILLEPAINKRQAVQDQVAQRSPTLVAAVVAVPILQTAHQQRVAMAQMDLSESSTSHENRNHRK
jgi:hypothetical protein